MPETFEAGLWDVTNEAYHRDRTAESHTTLETFRTSVPLYHAIYVAQTMRRDEPSESMILGSAAECRLQEPDRFERTYAQACGVDRRTKAGKDEYARFKADHPAAVILSAEQWLKVHMMAESLKAHPVARELLLDAPGTDQAAIRWRHESGVWLKARFDRILDDGRMCDLKCMRNPNPSAFAQSAATLGYHRQCGMYSEGARQLWQLEGEFFHIVCGNECPFEVSVCRFGEEAVRLGWKQTERDIERLATCRLEGRWDSEWLSNVNDIDLPKWAVTIK